MTASSPTAALIGQRVKDQLHPVFVAYGLPSSVQ